MFTAADLYWIFRNHWKVAWCDRLLARKILSHQGFARSCFRHIDGHTPSPTLCCQQPIIFDKLARFFVKNRIMKMAIP